MPDLSGLTHNQRRIRELEAEARKPVYYDIIIELKDQTFVRWETSGSELQIRRAWEAYLTAQFQGPKPKRMRLEVVNPSAPDSERITVLEEYQWTT